MDSSEDIEVDENLSWSFLNESSRSFTEKSNIRKGFNHHRRRGGGILEPISESSSNVNNFGFKLRANLSFNENQRTIKKPDRLCQSFTHTSNIYSSSDNSFVTDVLQQPSSPSKSQETIQTTPPSILRQRIKEAQERQCYLEKELNELQDFTTAERQILAVEKGYESLKEKYSFMELELDTLKEENKNLKMELEVSKSVNSSDLKEYLEHAKSEIQLIKQEKEDLMKELAETKRKLVDEEFKNDASEAKWKKREDELKKSLEEAWVLLQVKEDRLTKMKEKISLIYSEREIFDQRSHPSNIINSHLHPFEKIQALSTNVIELFNLSCNTFDNEDMSSISPNFLPGDCKGDSSEMKSAFDTKVLKCDLNKCCKTLAEQKKELEDLRIKCKENELTIQHFNDYLSNLGDSLEFHGNSNELNDYSCMEEHKTIFEKISCEFSQFRMKTASLSAVKSTNYFVEGSTQTEEKPLICDSSLSSDPVLDKTSNELDVNSRLIQDVNSLVSSTETEKIHISENDEVIKKYEDSIQFLENEIVCLKNQLQMRIDESLSTQKCEEEITSCNDKSIMTQPIFENANVAKEIIVKLCKNCEANDNLMKETTNIESHSLTCDEMASQTDLNLKSVSDYEDKIKSLEDQLLSKKKDSESLLSKSMQCSIEQNEVSSQTVVDFISINHYEEKIHNLETIMARSIDSSGKNVFDRSVQSAFVDCFEVSSQTDFNFPTVDKRELNVSQNELAICEGEIRNSCEDQNDVSSNHINSFLPVEPINNILEGENTELSSNCENLSSVSSLFLNESEFKTPDKSKALKTVDVCSQTDNVNFEVEMCKTCKAELINAKLNVINTTTNEDIKSNVSDNNVTINSEEKYENTSQSSELEYTSLQSDTTLDSVNEKQKQFNESITIKVKDTSAVDNVNMSLSDSVGEQLSKKSTLIEKPSSNSVQNQSYVSVEYVDLPDISTLDFTINPQLEHSILKSKLMMSDSYSPEVYDPLASISEGCRVDKPIVEIPFSHTLSLECELAKLKEKYQILNCQLENEIEHSKKSLSLINEIGIILSPHSSEVESDDVLNKLKFILTHMKETFENMKEFKDIGLLPSLKTLLQRNKEINNANVALKKSLNHFGNLLSEVKSIKSEFLLLSSNAELFRSLKSNFTGINDSVAELFKTYDLNMISKDLQSKENLENLIQENKELKEELSQLRLTNLNLKETSQLYSELLIKFTELQNDLNEKEKNINENSNIIYILQSFIDNIKDFTIIGADVCFSDQDFNRSSEYASLLLKTEKVLKDLQNTYQVFEKKYNFNDTNFFQCLEDLNDDKNRLEVSCNTLRSELKMKVSKFTSLFVSLKNSYNLLSSNMNTLKESVQEDIVSSSLEIQNLLKNKLELFEASHFENERLRSQINSLESELCHIKSECSLHLSLQENLKLNISQLESENGQLKANNDRFENDIMEQLNTIEKLKNEKENFVAQLSSLETLTPIQEKYSELIKSYDNLERELLQCKDSYNNYFELHESLKSKLSLMESENVQLKELVNSYENDISEYRNKLNSFERILNENQVLRDQIQNLESLTSVNDKYSELLKSSHDLTAELVEIKQAHEALKCSKSAIEESNNILKDTVLRYEEEIKEYEEKLVNVQKLQLENENLMSKLNEFDSLMSINEKHSKLLVSYQDLENELFKNKNDFQKNLELLECFREKNEALESENSNIKKEVLTCQNDLSEFKNALLSLEQKLIEKEKELSNVEQLHQEKIQEHSSLTDSYIAMKKDQEKYLKFVEDLVEFIKSSAKDITDSFLPATPFDFENIIKSLKSIYSKLVEFKKKYHTIEDSLHKVSDEKIELLKKVDLMNKDIEEYVLRKRTLEEELDFVKRDNENTELIKKSLSKFNDEINDILVILGYSGESNIDEKWMFIKQKIQFYKNRCEMINSDNQSDIVKNLEKRVSFLESELLDTDNFKRKFSKELHSLKPDLKVSDLMKLTLEDLQTTMLTTIMEKEYAVVANLEKDYETKLASSCDKIHQLEEEGKRRIDWIQEIENENSRLQNECEQAKQDNNNLRNDIKSKLDKILSLEKQIQEQKANANQILYGLYDEKHEHDTLEKEKSNSCEHALKESIADLNKQLEEKSKEYLDISVALHNKSETILHLEKMLNDIRTEKVHLEEEICQLKETMANQRSNFDEIKKSLEHQLKSYEVELANLKNIHNNKNTEMSQNEIESKILLIEQLEKLEKEADFVIKSNIANLLDTHKEKLEKLNTKVKELSIQLSAQNCKFSDLQSKESLIDSLKEEINTLSEINDTLKKENATLQSQRNELFEQEQEINVQEQNKILIEDLNILRKELDIIKREKDLLVDVSDENQELKNEIFSLNRELVECQSLLKSLENDKQVLLKDVDAYHKIKDENDILLKEINQYKDDFNNAKSECDKLNLEHNILIDKFSNLNDAYSKSQDELKTLYQERETLLSNQKNSSNSKEEVYLLNERLQNCHDELARLKVEKDNVVQEFISNLEFERSLKNSTKLELNKIENELLNSKKEKDLLYQELSKMRQTENVQINGLESKLNEINNVNEQLKIEVVNLKNSINEKNAYIQDLESDFSQIKLTYHSEESCPYKKEVTEFKKKSEECDKLLSHQQDTFNLWKTSIEEDLNCKVLLIGDLEAKLKKETQSYKESLAINKELLQKIAESDEKMKKLEEKMAMQREVFMREKIQLDSELKNKEIYELKSGEIIRKAEELAESINIFLDNVSIAVNKVMPDLGTVFLELSHLQAVLNEEKGKVYNLEMALKEENEIVSNLQSVLEEDSVKISHFKRELQEGKEKVSNLEKALEEKNAKLENLHRDLEERNTKVCDLLSELEEEKEKVCSLHRIVEEENKKVLSLEALLEEEREKVKELDEECEELNNNIKYLEDQLGKLYVSGDSEKISMEKIKEVQDQNEKIMRDFHEEKERNEKIMQDLTEAQHSIYSLQRKLENFEKKNKQYELEKKAFEININNLLEDKQKLLGVKSDLEKKLCMLETNKEQLKKNDSKQIDELMKEINHLKLQIVKKNTQISKLEMRLESDSLPFERRAEAAEKKVEELLKEVKHLRPLCKETVAIHTSPSLNYRVDPDTTKRLDQYVNTITRLEEEVRKLQKEKSSLKKLAILRHKEIKELSERLGLRTTQTDSEHHDSHH